MIGALLLALAISLFREATILTGGVAGVALLIDYASPIRFEIAFLVLNLPFFALALWRMGVRFTGATLVTIFLVSGLTAVISRYLVIDSINPVFAALAGGVLNGVGIVALFRHRSGVGGLTIMSSYLQDRGIARAGHVHLVTDLVIAAIALLIIPADKVALSVLVAVVFSFVLSANHRPGRYFG
nr:YitT family protein [Aquisalinus flavus]